MKDERCRVGGYHAMIRSTSVSDTLMLSTMQLIKGR